MTIAICLKVHDGIVLASDSASTLMTIDSDQNTSVTNIYNNTNKIFNLYKGLPIGAITWGSGSIGLASTERLMKDLRKGLVEGSEQLDKNTYTIESVATMVRKFFFDDHYVPTYRGWPKERRPQLGIIVAGYSAKEPLALEYEIDIVDGECSEPIPLREAGDVGITWGGVSEAISRLIRGYSVNLPKILVDNLGIPETNLEAISNVLQQNLTAPLVQQAMPIQDAINLARFLVDMTIQFHQYMPGAPTVGGPIEIAAITKHEGFTWVERKHYYDLALNPARRKEL